jgi:hypothetical protein
MAPVQPRGIVTAGFNLALALGQLISYSVVVCFGDRDDRKIYRAPFALRLEFAVFIPLESLPSAIHIICVFPDMQECLEEPAVWT